MNALEQGWAQPPEWKVGDKIRFKGDSKYSAVILEVLVKSYFRHPRTYYVVKYTNLDEPQHHPCNVLENHYVKHKSG